jgi:chaperone modulatory protein CbpM
MSNISLTNPISVQLLDESAALSLAELCRACSAPTEFIVEMVEEGVVSPQGSAPESWRFSGIHLERARIALRLQRDLGVNLAGAALALQLLEELQALRARLLER